MASTAEWTSGNTTFSMDADAGTFVVAGSLDFTVERDFQRACTRFLDGEARLLFIDLSGVKFICSSCLGSLFLLHDSARIRGMKLRVRLSRKIDPVPEQVFGLGSKSRFRPGKPDLKRLDGADGPDFPSKSGR